MRDNDHLQNCYYYSLSLLRFKQVVLFFWLCPSAWGHLSSPPGHALCSALTSDGQPEHSLLHLISSPSLHIEFIGFLLQLGP